MHTIKQRIFAGVLALLLVTLPACTSGTQQKPADVLKLGMCLYDANDTFITHIQTQMLEKTKRYEQQTGYKIDLDISDANNNQRTQNEQVERYVALDYDVICVNLVDRSDVSEIIRITEETGTPILFFNRKPVEQDILNYDHFYYIGVSPEESARLQSEVIIQYWHENHAEIDKNGDGVLSYVMLQGEAGHQDTIVRSQFVIECLAKEGIETENLATKMADWERNQAFAIMDEWITTFGDEIEFVICNNDDMALGAADAVAALSNADEERLGEVAIVGIDATEVGLEAIKKGSLIGTVDAGARSYADYLFGLALSLMGRDDYDVSLEDMHQQYIEVPMYAVTQKDVVQ